MKMSLINENCFVVESDPVLKKTLDGLLNLDFLIYSSHKSGTQTLVSSLNNSGVKSRHIHGLSGINLAQGSFPNILDYYLARKNKKMNVISVFRNPFERHISSFFQRYGTTPLLRKEVNDISETLIYKLSIDELQDKFLYELKSQSLHGFSDSLHEIFKELKISSNDLKYDDSSKYGVYETEKIKLTFFRHDTFFYEFENLLSEVSGVKIIQRNRNMSNDKFYKKIYAEFKRTLSVPGNVISEVYDAKIDLMGLFYGSKSESIINQCRTKFQRVDE